MAIFAIDGDVGCPFSLLTLFLGQAKRQSFLFDRRFLATRRVRHVVPNKVSRPARAKPRLIVNLQKNSISEHQNNGIRFAHMDTRSGSGMTVVEIC